VLWQQDISSNTSAYVNQVFPDEPTASSFLADDFTNTEHWRITSIYVPGNGWNYFSTFANATSLNWEIYGDDNGTPDGDPLGGGNPPVWSLSLAPDDPQITITNGIGGYPTNTRVDLDTPVILPPGTWWLIFYPDMSFSTGGQYGRHLSDTTNGSPGMFINPGNYFGYGTDWQSAAVLAGSDYDLAFTLEGNPVCPLFVTYKEVLTERLYKKPIRRRLTVTGGEGFDPFGEIDLGVIAWRKAHYNKKKNILKIGAVFPYGLAPGMYPIRVGDCYGEIEVTGYVPPIP